MTAEQPERALLIVGDYGDERCGVGSSEAALGDAVGGVVVIDPAVPSARAFRRAVRAALPGAAGAMVAYPTLSLVERKALVPRLLWLRLRLGRRRWLRVHLHEFLYLRRPHRFVVAALVGLIADRVVVSSEREAAAARTLYRGWAGRHDVLVRPPANPSGPSGGLALVDPPPHGRRVGVHGQLRPDKGFEWLVDVLRRLDRRYDQLEIVGRDWDVEWPEDLRQRFTITPRGQLPRSDLAGAFATWDLAIAPFALPPYDGRLSLRTPLAHGVPTLTRGPRPEDLQLDAVHLWFDDAVDLGALPELTVAQRRAGAAAIEQFETRWRSELRTALLAP